MSNEEIKEKIELLKEFLEYGMEYKDYIQVENAFEDIKKIIEKQDKIINYMIENYIECPYTNDLEFSCDDCEEQNVGTCTDTIKEYILKEMGK